MRKSFVVDERSTNLAPSLCAAPAIGYGDSPRAGKGGTEGRERRAGGWSPRRVAQGASADASGQGSPRSPRVLDGSDGDDVLAVEFLEAFLDVVAVVVGAAGHADHHAALLQSGLVGLGVRLGDAQADQAAQHAAGHGPGP